MPENEITYTVIYNEREDTYGVMRATNGVLNRLVASYNNPKAANGAAYVLNAHASYEAGAHNA